MTSSKDFPKGFAGTEHYREKAAKANDMVESVIERTALEGTAQAWKETAVSWAHAFDRDIEALCDHIEEQDKEIERLREQVRVAEHRARNLADDVGTLREMNTGLRLENRALQAEEE